jgi:hypothetical protein
MSPGIKQLCNLYLCKHVAEVFIPYEEKKFSVVCVLLIVALINNIPEALKVSYFVSG